MTVYAYLEKTAINPVAPITIARSANFTVHDTGDISFLTPLNLTRLSDGATVTALLSDSNGYLPDFTATDRTSVVIYDSASGFTKTLVTSTPVPGAPNKLSIGTVTAGSTPTANLSGTAPAQVLNLTLPKGDKGDIGQQGTPGDLSAWKASTAYTVGQPIVNPNGYVVTTTVAHTSTSKFDATKFTAPNLELRSGRDSDAVGGFLDSNRAQTWLTHTADGGPTKYASQRARAGVGIKDAAARSGLGGGFLDQNSMETDLVFGPDGHITDRVMTLWSSRLGLAGQAATPTKTATRSAWGHSLVQADVGGSTPWEGVLSGLLGVPVSNYGVGGQWSRHVAARQGGKAALITATGNAIPASGSVNITMSQDFLIGTGTRTGTLAGVPGTVARTAAIGADGGSASGTFTRTTSGSVVNIPNGAPFFPDNGVLTAADVIYIWAARNDFFKADTSPAESVENISRMVDYLTPVKKKFLIFEEPPGAPETTGTPDRATVDQYNAAIRAAFPQAWVPVMTWLRTQAAADSVGYTFTTQDNADIANGVTPTGFRYDTLHLNTLGNQALAHRIQQEEIARGWI